MTIVQAIDAKSGRQNESRNIMDALSYYFETAERMNISDGIKDVSGYNITRAIDAYSGKGDVSPNIVTAIDNYTGQGPSQNIMDAISHLDNLSQEPEQPADVPVDPPEVTPDDTEPEE